MTVFEKLSLLLQAISLIVSIIMLLSQRRKDDIE